MKKPVIREIYISLLNCKNKIIQLEPTSSLVLPLVKEESQKTASLPTVNGQWAQESLT